MISVKIVGGLAEIRPRQLPDTNLELTAVKAYSVLLADFDGIWYYTGFMLRVVGISSFCQFSIIVFSVKPTLTIIGVLNASS
jgi:hypothetical protein